MLYLSLKEGILATSPRVAFPRALCSVSTGTVYISIGPVWRFHEHHVAFRRALYGVSTGTMWHFRGHHVAFPQAQCGVSTAMCGVSSAVWVSCGLGFVCSVLYAAMSCTGVANRSMDSSLVTVPLRKMSLPS